MYKLDYCEWHGYMSVDGNPYGGLVLCHEYFDDYFKMQEYIRKNECMWEPNPNWEGKSYQFEIVAK